MPSKVALSDLLGETPAPIQLQLLGATQFEIAMVTGFAAGKTRAICAKSLDHAVRHPGAKILIGRRTYHEMRDTVKQPWFTMADKLHRAGWIVKPKNWDYREGTNHASLVNGSQFFFSNLDDPIKFRNEEFSMVIVDQAEEIAEELWEMLLARIRYAKVAPRGWQAVAAANDNGHNWIWRRFVADPNEQLAQNQRCSRDQWCTLREGHPDVDGKSMPIPCATRRFFHGTTLDNAHNLSRTYLAQLLSKPELWKRHFIYATMEGGAGKLLPSPRVVPHFDPPATWPRYRAIDHALKAPCCCLWIAVNTGDSTYRDVPPGAPYVYREYWAEERSVDQHVREILALSAGERVDATIIDHSAFRKDQSRQGGILISIADLYASEGLMCIPSTGLPFARVERINQAHNRGMAVSDRCRFLIRTMPEYYAEQSKSDGTFSIKNRSDFHAVDALGYGLGYIPIDVRDLALVPDNLGAPDYVRNPSPDAASARHNRAEWRRMQRVVDQNEQLTEGQAARGSFASTEFWSDDPDPVFIDPFIVGRA